MFENWNTKRKLRRELTEYDEFYAAQFRAAKTEDDYYPVKKVYDQETAGIVSKLRWMDTQGLIRRARKYGVEPQPYDWDIPTVESHWEANEYTGQRYLSNFGAAQLTGDTSAAKFALWKKWIDVISPVASVVISILAFALATLALYLQLTGKLR